MGRFLTLSVVLAVIWLLLSGYFDKPLLLFFGAVSVLFTAWISVRAGVVDGEGVPTGLMPGIFAYWVWLAGEIGKSNVIVARQALAITPKLSPKMVKVPMPPRSAAGIATYANSITLTPGTVSVDLEPDHLLVHALTEDLADEKALIDIGEHVARLEHGPEVDGARGTPR
ncbi:MAG: Na+/H+ antiporter subunit E [Pseudomonadota bacterium]